MSGTSRHDAPAVTVCVTCYNQEAYIRQCLDGILAQDFDAPMEILIGDDGSTDGSIAIIEKCAARDSRICLIRRPKNLGYTRNEQDLFGRAKGEFVGICEADDIWNDPQKLRRQVALMSARPDVSLCISAGFKMTEDGRTAGELRISREAREISVRELIAEPKGRVPTASLLMRRAALEALPEEIYAHVAIDYSLQVLLGVQGKVLYDPEPAVSYRVASRGSYTEGLAQSTRKYLEYHEGLRAYQEFLVKELGSEYARDIQRALESIVLGFYMSSRISPVQKRRNLPQDLPRLRRPAQILARLFTRVPAVVAVGAFARRKIWVPISRPFRQVA